MAYGEPIQQDRQTRRWCDKVRRNWGYWDGVADRQTAQRPWWNRKGINRMPHPHDPAYGEGYWMGFHAERHPNTGLVPTEAARYDWGRCREGWQSGNWTAAVQRGSPRAWLRLPSSERP